MQKLMKRKRTGSQRLGKLIKESRLKKGLSGGKLAALVGIDRTHISKIEHGVHAPDFLVAKKISQALEEPEIIYLFLNEQHPDIADFYAEAKKLKELLAEHNIDFKTAYNKLVKGQPL